jgi:hypothetical protein
MASPEVDAKLAQLNGRRRAANRRVSRWALATLIPLVILSVGLALEPDHPVPATGHVHRIAWSTRGPGEFVKWITGLEGGFYLLVIAALIALLIVTATIWYRSDAD